MVSAALTSVCANSGSFPLAWISAARRSSTFGYSWIRPAISRTSSSMTLSSVSICSLQSGTNKKPHSAGAMGSCAETRSTKRLSLVGLPNGCGLTFFGHQLPGGADCVHGDGIMLGRVADNHAEFTALTTVNDDFRHHLAGIEVEAVGLRTIHDAQSAPLLGPPSLVDDLRYVIHASWVLLSP